MRRGREKFLLTSVSEKQLVDMKVDEQAVWEKGREDDMSTYIREALGNLQVNKSNTISIGEL